MNTGQKFVHLPTISDSTKLSLLVHTLDIAIKVGRHLSVISICLTCLNLTLAVNDFIANNLGFAILNSMFVISGLVFIIQTHLTDRIHHVRYHG